MPNVPYGCNPLRTTINDILEWDKFIIALVHIYIIIDGDKADIVLREDCFGVMACPHLYTNTKVVKREYRYF